MPRRDRRGKEKPRKTHDVREHGVTPTAAAHTPEAALRTPEGEFPYPEAPTAVTAAIEIGKKPERSQEVKHCSIEEKTCGYTGRVERPEDGLDRVVEKTIRNTFPELLPQCPNNGIGYPECRKVFPEMGKRVEDARVADHIPTT